MMEEVLEVPVAAAILEVRAEVAAAAVQAATLAVIKNLPAETYIQQNMDRRHPVGGDRQPGATAHI